MIILGYIGVALVVGVGAAILAVMASRASGPVRVFLRCLRWGVATGAATGGVVGALVLLVPGLVDGDERSLVGLTPVGAIYGAVIGAIVSLIPTLVGASVVAGLIGSRHPHSSSENAVKGDLTAIFRAVVGLLNAAVLIAFFASGPDLASVAYTLTFMVAGNACVVLMLCRARGSIGRLWSPGAG